MINGAHVILYKQDAETDHAWCLVAGAGGIIRRDDRVPPTGTPAEAARMVRKVATCWRRWA